MDFFAHQDHAKSQTRWLIIMFVIAVMGMIASINLALAAILPSIMISGTAHHTYLYNPASLDFLNKTLQAVRSYPEPFIYATLGTLGIIIIGSIYKTIMLAGSGGHGIAANLGGRMVGRNPTDADEKRFVNVVEEMAIAAGLPMPEVYILDGEHGINAFAAGFKSDNAVVGVTRGAVKELSRDELQGVIAHEFSHIFHGDMLLNMRLMGLLHGLLMIGLVGEYLLRSSLNSRRRSSKDNKGQVMLVGLSIWIIGYLGLFLGAMIKAAISRQREFLADASAVQYTRNPLGLAGALKRIGTKGGSRICSANAAQVSHLFFARGFGSHLEGLWATHPPLKERIARLDRSFQADEWCEQRVSVSHSSVHSQLTGDQVITAAASKAVDQIGQVSRAGIAEAQAIHQQMTPLIKAAYQETYSARLLVCALIMSADPVLVERQVALVVTNYGDQSRAALLSLSLELKKIGLQARLPILDLCLPTLKLMSPNQLQEFSNTLQQLTMLDKQVDLFEFVLFKILARYLRPARPPKPSNDKLPHAAAVVLSALSYAGHSSDSERDRAYVAGMEILAAGHQIPPRLKLEIKNLDEALTVIEVAVPKAKRMFVRACFACVLMDGKTTLAEAELLRGINAAIGVPIQPVISWAQVVR